MGNNDPPLTAWTWWAAGWIQWFGRYVLHKLIPPMHRWVRMTPEVRTCRRCGAQRRNT